MLSSSIQTDSVDRLTVRVYATPADLVQEAVEVAASALQTALDRQGEATVIFATGNSQIPFLDALLEREELDWTQVTAFHLDEYLGIDREHPASFRRYLRERVAERVPLRQFHYLAGDTLEPLDECDRYTRLLQERAIDLCCLGIGENGHLAFNDPDVADFNDPRRVKLVKLDDTNRQQQVKEGHFPDLDAVPRYAFTLTLPAICAAGAIVCLAPEQRKAIAVRNMLTGSPSADCPASILRSCQRATLFLDLDSASLLSSD